MKRALGLLALAALQLAAVPVRTHAPTGDVLGVSVVSAPGRAEVVVDIRGTVEVTDFVLQTPPRLVLDLTGARLVGRHCPTTASTARASGTSATRSSAPT